MADHRCNTDRPGDLFQLTVVGGVTTFQKRYCSICGRYMENRVVEKQSAGASASVSAGTSRNCLVWVVAFVSAGGGLAWLAVDVVRAWLS